MTEIADDFAECPPAENLKSEPTGLKMWHLLCLQIPVVCSFSRSPTFTDESDLISVL